MATPAPAPLHENRSFVKHLRRLHDLPVRSEHRGVGKAALDQLKAHQAIVHSRERGAGELDHIDLNPLTGQVVHQVGNQVWWALTEEKRSMNQIDTQHAEGFLLDVRERRSRR